MINRFFTILVLNMAVMFCSITGFSFTDAIFEAVQAVHSNTATPLQEATSFANNKKINHLRLLDLITDAEYQANQRFFQKINDDICQEAAMETGLKLVKQQKLTQEGYYFPGTNTDNLVKCDNGDITLEDMEYLRDSYNEKVTYFLVLRGYPFSETTDWAKKTDTDFLPHYCDTREFSRITRWINSLGGNAYENAYAAEVESLIREQSSAIPLFKAIAYSEEMTRQLECSLEKLNSNKKKYLRKVMHEYSKDVRNNNAIDHKLSAHIAKYINRKYMIAQAMADIYTQTE